ncbi:MAG: hypothetical protein HPY59_14280 [Anaerolineae bacterium]|nr:hypothetical protein [Anaerolineae bacterium]
MVAVHRSGVVCVFLQDRKAVRRDGCPERGGRASSLGVVVIRVAEGSFLR